jgi:TetR/AcrR family transcriptional repressor of nem operon
MRYKPEHKAETHRRIVETAAKEFRTHGFEGIGIAKLMGALELTHGGFYAHFADKEALVAESSVVALDQSLEMLLGALEAGGFPALLNYYLSEEHRDQPASGCMLPTLTAELSRHPTSSREAFTEKLAQVYDAVAEYMPGKTHVQKLEKVNVMFASMVGALSLARAVSDPALSTTILRSTREHLLKFVEESAD